MPELPEVETIARGLSKVLKGKRIKQVRMIFPKIVKQDCGLFDRELARKTIKAVRRRGKYLLIDLSGAKTILVHLGMTGSFLFAREATASPLDKHDHVIMTFRDCDELLRYNDQRRFVSFLSLIRFIF